MDRLRENPAGANAGPLEGRGVCPSRANRKRQTAERAVPSARSDVGSLSRFIGRQAQPRTATRYLCLETPMDPAVWSKLLELYALCPEAFWVPFSAILGYRSLTWQRFMAGFDKWSDRYLEFRLAYIDFRLKSKALTRRLHEADAGVNVDNLP